MKKIYLVLFAFTISACSTVNYVAPEQYEDIELNKVINRSFDDTWSSIIDYASASFFGIDTFEKSSGLITLTFGTQNPELYADCGDFSADYWTGLVNEGQVTFEGNYMEWIARNGGNLSGSMNITARSLDDQETQIRVNAGYLITYPTEQGTHTWNFSTGGGDTSMVMSQGRRAERTCVSTGEAEKLILEAIDNLATN